ncbi:MAG: hypothetical protein ABJO67_21430 [Pseudoruegeria sp.]
MLEHQTGPDARIGTTEFLADYSFYECHTSELISAQPAQIIEAVASLDMRDDKLADFALSLREMPDSLRRKLKGSGQSASKKEFGFDSFTLLKRTDYEVSRGLIGRFWNPVLDLQDVGDVSEFCDHSDTTQAKLVLRFLVTGTDGPNHQLVTETFIYCPTRRTKLFFTPYWFAIRLMSGWLRKRTLTSIRKTLTASKTPPVTPL